MGLILYTSGKNESSASLLQIVKNAVPDQAVETYSSVDDLSERLHESLLDVSVAVLCAANRSELIKIIDLGSLLDELRLVLVLPDGEPDMIGKAHLLRPRFIASSQSDFSHLGQVLKRMMDIYEKK